MIEFNSLFVSTWHDRGVLHAAPSMALPKTRRSITTKVSAALSAFAVGVALSATSLPAFSGTALLGVRVADRATSARERAEVPPGYYPALVRAVKQAKQLPDAKEEPFPDPGI